MGGAPTQRNWNPISTDNASWGGPQHREFRKEILQAIQVWVGPNTEKFEKKFYKQCKFGNQS
ncbi:conserved hypothetical protein [Staphylococcus argenteus]|uniref:Nitrogen regulation protein NIFR3 n=1 Tax=Staphylococcus argenteus TaxID=985002 RepID=A0A7U7PYJ0_9STAP|nr:conserved hypothetical protein [Staphylococcus argenteus]CRI27298.1 conserved hypothetical protein [Staphylococcus argenteus]